MSALDIESLLTSVFVFEVVQPQYVEAVADLLRISLRPVS